MSRSDSNPCSRLFAAGDLQHPDVADAGGLGDSAKAGSTRDGSTDRLTPGELGTGPMRRSASDPRKLNHGSDFFGQRTDDLQVIYPFKSEGRSLQADIQGSKNEVGDFVSGARIAPCCLNVQVDEDRAGRVGGHIVPFYGIHAVRILTGGEDVKP